MSIKEQLTLAAGLAVALAMSALFPIYDGGNWVMSSLGAILVVVVTGLVTRRLGVPGALQPLLSLLLLVGYLLVVFVGDTMSSGIVPTSRSVDALQALWTQAQHNIQHYGPPVPVSRGLVMVTAAGVGAVALVVDMVAVVLDRAAVSGLALLVLLAVPSAVLPHGIGGLPFVLGAIGWLGLLLVEGSERVGRWGTPMRSSLPGARPGEDDSSLGRVGRRIGIAAVGAAVIIPWLTPGLDHRLVGGGAGVGGSGGKGGPQTANTYNPITRLAAYLDKQDPVPLFDYITSDANPDYVRMTTLDTYDDGVWRATELKADPKKARVRDGIPTPSEEQGQHRDFTMTVALREKALDVRWLPVPYGPKKIDVDVSWLWEKRSQTVFSAGQTTRDLATYKVRASRVLPDRDALRAASLDDVVDAVRASYLTLPTVDQYVTSLTDRIVRGETTEYDQAIALQNYFTAGHGFVYDLQASKARPGQDQLVAFLQGKHGFCEQYATAMAVMLRVAGIPSRVAVGFTAGEKQTAKDGSTFYEVTTQQAHAWPEAWFAGTGWVRFEPTPGASQATVPDYALASSGPRPGDPTAPNPTATATPGAKPSATLPPGIARILNDDKAITATGTTGSSGSDAPSLWLVAPVVATVLLVLPFGLTLLRRRVRWADAGPLTAWEQLVDDATDVGWTWQGADSPRAAATRLASGTGLPDPAQQSLRRIAGAAERARYAPPESQLREDLARDSATVRAALQAQASRSVRLRALLFPPSTLRWASTSLSARLFRIMDAVDDTIAAITRPVRRRTASR
ncbi:MAG: transglutaminaseTgpA domain-containing protein [Mycobacteriales bacterium]